MRGRPPRGTGADFELADFADGRHLLEKGDEAVVTMTSA